MAAYRFDVTLVCASPATPGRKARGARAVDLLIAATVLAGGLPL